MLVSVQQDWFVFNDYAYSLGKIFLTPGENNYSRLPCEVFVRRKTPGCNDHTVNVMLLFSFRIAFKCKQSCRDQARVLSLALILGYNAGYNPLVSVIV